jgi:hypothetical protein
MTCGLHDVVYISSLLSQLTSSHKEQDRAAGRPALADAARERLGSHVSAQDNGLACRLAIDIRAEAPSGGAVFVPVSG